MKKLLTVLLSCLVMFSLIGERKVRAFDGEFEIKPLVHVYNVDVWRDEVRSLSKNGCWAEATFSFRGSYTVSNDKVQSDSISVSITNKPSDWTVEITSVSKRYRGNSVDVTVHYRFNSTYFDCPIGGGYSYQTFTLGV